MRVIVVLGLLVACGQEQAPRTPQAAPAPDRAIAALRAAKFDVALAEARDSKQAQAAAVRAVARYQRAGSKLVADLGKVLDSAEGLKFFDHEQGRAAWLAFLGELDAVDRDLELAAADPSFALELCIACWEHDWNHNGRVDDRDRKLFELEFDGKGGEIAEGDPRRRPTYRFDHGDVLWARSMIAFQRAAVELVLAYRWSELDKLFLAHEPDQVTIKLTDPGRVKHTRELVLAGLTYADQTREAYLAETDDDREWVPNPRQHSYAMPLDVDAKLYDTWAAVIGDVRRLLESKEGISIREVDRIGWMKFGDKLPAAFIDVGRMLREPTDIVVRLDDSASNPGFPERLLRGMLGNGYSTSMRASPLVARLRHMRDELDNGQDTLERKLRYLLWLN